jgi:endonuclease/exonuclease/phosphatase family metal-dependent hydrolase
MINSVGTMGSGKVRIVTLNCLFVNRPRARLRVIGRLLKEMAPDVTCLQEIFFRRNVSLLEDDRAAFGPGGLGVAGGLVTLTRGAVESWRFERFRTSLWFEHLARKGFLVTRLRLAGEPVTVVNTHLLANYSENWALDNYYARRQLEELTQLTEAIRLLSKEELVIVAGDFNVPAPSPQFKDFMAACGLSSAVDWSALPPGGRGLIEIDNILFRPPLGRAMAGTTEFCFEEQIELDGGHKAFPSDHVGLEAVLEW